MSVRLITVGEIEIGMVSLEAYGRARVTKTYPVSYGYGYEAVYLEGPHADTKSVHQAIPEVTVWIEEGPC